MNRNPCLAIALEELAKAGIHHPIIANGGKHMQLRWAAAGGQPRMMPIPGTPSDWRTPENVRRDIRHILRADNMLAAPEPKAPPPPRQPSRIELLERRLAEVERRLGIEAGQTPERTGRC
jgi:hypothetical protein